jgi:hypothetical protein
VTKSPRHFLMRLVRGGALVPARLRWLDHEPGEPDNPRDRWPPFVVVCDIAGEVRPPEELTDRFHWPASHWKHAAPISEGEYRYQLARLRWAERHRPQDPTLQPRRPVDPRQVALPSFAREREALR